MKSYLEYYKYRVLNFLYRKSFRAFLSEKQSEIIQALDRDGYYVYEDFYDAETCNHLVEEIDNILKKEGDNLWKDKEQADFRVFGAERTGGELRNYARDEEINLLSRAYLNTKTTMLTSMANRIVAKQGNKGSGGGWHRDTNFIQQFKSIVYLVDVDENGPFQYLKGTHKKHTLFTFSKYGIQFDQNRIDQKNVDAILNDDSASLVEFKAKAGTLLLVDTSGIHRGKPLDTGTRYAITNYFYQDYFIDANLRDKFNNISVQST